MKNSDLKKDRIKIKIHSSNGFIDVLAKIIKVNDRLYAIHGCLYGHKQFSKNVLTLTEFTTGKKIDDFVINKNVPVIGLIVQTIVQVERTNNLDEVIKQFPSVNKLTDKTEKKVYDLGKISIKQE